MNHLAQISWNENGTVDQISVYDYRDQRVEFVLEDMGEGEWDVHIGYRDKGFMHLSLGEEGLVQDMTPIKRHKNKKKLVVKKRFQVSYQGFADIFTDNLIQSIAASVRGIQLTGSGYSFLEGKRDISFSGEEDKVQEVYNCFRSVIRSNKDIKWELGRIYKTYEVI